MIQPLASPYEEQLLSDGNLWVKLRCGHRVRGRFHVRGRQAGFAKPDQWCAYCSAMKHGLVGPPPPPPPHPDAAKP